MFKLFLQDSLALNPTAAPVQAVDDLLHKARTAGDAARACLAAEEKTGCATPALENLRAVSPESLLMTELHVRARMDKDIEDARRCIVRADLACAEQHVKRLSALSRTAGPVQAVNGLLLRARTANGAARACLARDEPECVASALENLRMVSPESSLVTALLRKLAEASAPAAEAAGSASANTSATLPIASATPAPAQPLQSAAIPASTPPLQSAPASTGIVQPDIRVGDRWVSRTTDHNVPASSYTTERIVTEVGAARMTLLSRKPGSRDRRMLTFTREWNLVSEREPDGSRATYTPPLRYLSFPLEQGKTWRAEARKQRSDGSDEQIYSVVGEVQAFERVQVAAGSFEAVKVVVKLEVRENEVLILQSRDTSWYSPEARRSVRTELVNDDLRSGQQILRTIELVEYSVSR